MALRIILFYPLIAMSDDQLAADRKGKYCFFIFSGIMPVPSSDKGHYDFLDFILL
jgi:hypothetical protein